MDPLVVLLIIVTTILTILLVIVGIQVILILKEIRITVSRLNHSLDNIDQFISRVSSPLGQVGGMLEGLKSGMRLAEGFVSWLKKNSPEDEEDE